MSKDEIGIDLGGKEIKAPEFSLLDGLPNETKQELEKTEYVILGKGENSCIVLPKPKTYSYEPFELDYFPGSKIQPEEVKYLVITPDGRELFAVFKLYKPFTQDEAIKKETHYSNIHPLEEFQRILKEQNTKEQNSCIFQINNGHDMLMYSRYQIENKGIVNNEKPSFTPHKEFFLENAGDTKTFFDINKLEEKHSR